MAFSMHSHSGQFCEHAVDSLEEVIQTAIARGMKTFALTEHMPRNSEKDLYPEEESLPALHSSYENFIVEALRLQEKYKGEIVLLIGFEGEWIRHSYGELITEFASNPAIDFFIGSVHHVHEIPIDYDRACYDNAKAVAGGTDERLFEDYFDLQFEMLQALRPKVVGHFDLIRLLSADPNGDLRDMNGVWERAVRNLEFVVGYGGLLEVNTSALRKGLKEPYPTRSICEYFLNLGGRLTLSDDSHGVSHVGTNFEKCFAYLDTLGVRELWTLDARNSLNETGLRRITLEDVQMSFRP